MNIPYSEPSYKKNEFNCPYCRVYAHQSWHQVSYCIDDKVKLLPSYRIDKSTEKESAPIQYSVSKMQYTPQFRDVRDASLSQCFHCKNYVFWIEDKMIYPVVSLAPMPSDDMPNDVKADYMEAASVIETSPRASSALLRLALQKLMPHLGEKGSNLNEDIGSLVKKGLPLKIQQSLDVVRVIGNESVHPGSLDLKDDKETAYLLFSLLNLIVEDRITRQREIDVLYSKLPTDKLKGIENRGLHH